MKLDHNIPDLRGQILAVTGHRPEKLGGYDPKTRWRLIELASRMLISMPSKVITGMALGWDQAVAQAAIDLSIPVVAAIPFRGQERMWPLHARERYHRILEQCMEMHIVCIGPYDPSMMQRRNRWMVDRTKMLGALWDGSHGGTENCLRYAYDHETCETPFNLWTYWHEDYSRRTPPHDFLRNPKYL